MINWEDIGADWTGYQRYVGQRWVKLSPKDLDVIAGDRTILVAKLQERYGLAKEQAENAVASFVDRFPPEDDA
jgi:uncharacterized protein YjbJ (UPF0337 family)